MGAEALSQENQGLNIGEAYLLSVGYDGERRKAFLKLYDTSDDRIKIWYDDTGHLPYCISKDPLEELERNEGIAKHPGLAKMERAERYDALRDRRLDVVIIYAKDPLAIGGRPSGCIRDLVRAWEANIKYAESYIYDLGLVPCMPYRVSNGRLSPMAHELPMDAVAHLEAALEGEDEDHRRAVREWISLLEAPMPKLKRVALDIEVYSPIATRVPDPDEAEHPILCIGFFDNEGRKRILILDRGEGFEAEPLPGDLEASFFKSEADMLRAAFDIIREYPIVLTFNGDDFDLNYIWHRAQRLGMGKGDIPLEVGRESISIKNGIHIDLYKFFVNKSMQVYAFRQKYREMTLDDVGMALLGEGKRKSAASVSEMSYSELAAYCMKDAELTMRLSTYDDELVMKLIVVLSRISFLGIEDVSRQGVSNWIRSMLYREHRRRGYLIPRPDEILELKGTTATEATIKGKKYKGAIVVEPKPGVHFGVAVLDFASLYPSIIKMWNLGYETILCPHEECRDNLVPDTPHWICRKRRAIQSVLIGSLRDVRVKWYKPKSKDKTLPEPKRNWYMVVQDALKVILNASYGVFGAETFSLYCPPVAEATAAIGRYVIRRAIEKAKSLGVEVLYGDTDSIFLGTTDQALLNELVRWAKEELGMELEIDKYYRYLALSSRKKNYLGVREDGSVDIKGLTGKKRHVPEFLKKAFYDMIQILSEVRSFDEFNSARERIKRIVRECYLKLKNREYSLEELAFNVMMGKSPEGYTKTTPQHVKAARLLSQRGIEIKPGDLIAFVKVTGELGVKPVQLASKNEIDTEKYLEYISSTFEQVLDALGIEFDELIGVRRLESFFGPATRG
jgi:DNA polymerase I